MAVHLSWVYGSNLVPKCSTIIFVSFVYPFPHYLRPDSWRLFSRCTSSLALLHSPFSSQDGSILLLDWDWYSSGSIKRLPHFCLGPDHAHKVPLAKWRVHSQNTDFPWSSIRYQRWVRGQEAERIVKNRRWWVRRCTVDQTREQAD